MKFEEAYDKYIQLHISKRTGEASRRLKEGLGYAETMFLAKVWWPAFNNFENLHPQYEVIDYKDGYRYIDFAYIRPHFKIAIEVDGLGPHWRNISKWQLGENWQRQNHLVIDRWNVLRFIYEQINEQPRVCQQTIQQMIGQWLGGALEASELNIFEREVIRLVQRSPRPITPKDVCQLLGVQSDYVHKMMKRLIQTKWLEPRSGTIRIRKYGLHASRSNVRL